VSVSLPDCSNGRRALSTTRRLGEVIEFRNEIIHPKDNPRGTITFVGLEHVESNTGTRIGSEQIRLEEMSGRRSRFYAGDIVYGYLRPYLNKVWIAEFDGICSVDQYVFKVRPIADRNYVAHFLRSPQFLKTAPVNLTPGQLPRIRSGEIAETSIPFPAIEEQRRITAILDQADDLRRKRRNVLNVAGTLLGSVFLDAFGDPSANPRGWPTRTLGEASIRFSDGPFGSNLKSKHYVDAGIRVIRLQNIGVGEFLDTDKAFISEKHFSTLRKHSCLPGDILIGTLGDPNLRAVIQPSYIPVALNKADCVQMRVNPAICTPEFVSALLNLPSTEAMAQNKILGQTRLRISMGRLRELSVPMPPVELQHAFASRIAEIDKLKSQHRAFRGEL
jgi:type I restriction enzyme, S subunit